MRYLHFQEEPTTTEATPDSKGGRKAWQTLRKRIPKKLDFTLGSNQNLFQGRVESWNDERESEQLGNILDDEKDETLKKEDEEGGLVRGGGGGEEAEPGKQKDINDNTGTTDEVSDNNKNKKEDSKPVGRKGWAQNGRKQRRLKSNFGEIEQLVDSTRDEEAVLETPFKDPHQRLARISRRHRRKEVDEDDSKDEDTVEEEDDNDFEEEIDFLVSGTQRGRKAWLNTRRRSQ